MPRSRLLPLLPAAFLLACGEPSATNSAFATRDSAGLTIAENDLGQLTASCELDSVPRVSIGGVEDSEDDFLYRVMGATRLSDGRIVVVNQGTQEVRWYGRDGRLVGRAGREGRGPGEFSAAFIIAQTTGDTVWVGDSQPWQWHVFGPEMSFVRTVRLDPAEINFPRAYAILDDGRQLFARSSLGHLGEWQLDSLTVMRYRADGNVVDTVMRLPYGRYGNPDGPETRLFMQPWFEGTAHLVGGGDRAIVATWGEPELTVYRIGVTMTPLQVIRWTTGDRTISQADVEAARTRTLNQYPDLDPRMKKIMIDPMVNPERPVADRFPAMAGMELARDGRIWVREYVKPDTVVPSHSPWIGFDQGGRAVCRAELPSLGNAGEIGADYILRLDRDSLGVERVQEYRLGAPAGVPG